MRRALSLLAFSVAAYLLALLLMPAAFDLTSSGWPRLAFAVAVVVFAISGAALIGWLTREHAP